MSIIDGQKGFEELCLAFNGNRYAAVVHVATAARNLLTQYHNAILESQAISWVLTGVVPEGIGDPSKPKKRRVWARSYISQVLEYVTDKEVREAVQDTILESTKEFCLHFVYNDVDDEPRRSRIRILSRMAWVEISKS